MSNEKGGEVSVGDIIEALSGLVEVGLPVQETEVIGALHSLDLGVAELRHLLQVCQRGKQVCLTARVSPASYEAIIDYINLRLSKI